MLSRALSVNGVERIPSSLQSGPVNLGAELMAAVPSCGHRRQLGVGPQARRGEGVARCGPSIGTTPIGGLWPDDGTPASCHGRPSNGRRGSHREADAVGLASGEAVGDVPGYILAVG